MIEAFEDEGCGFNSSFEQDRAVLPNYVEYRPGDVGIILSIPHGGYADDSRIPTRTSGYDESTGESFRTLADGWTIQLGDVIEDTIADLLGGLRPYVVICHLKRAKVDVNREIQDGAQGDPIASRTHRLYHAYIRKAQEASSPSAGGRGLLIDLHGQNHKQNSTEVGYLLGKEALNRQELNPLKSSIRALAEETGLGGDDLIVGELSLGHLIEQEGYRAVPSPRQPSPGKDKYYSGGYITRSHGSAFRSCMPVSCAFDAIQLETPREPRVEGGEAERTRFGMALGRAIVNFYRLHYLKDLTR